MNRSGQDLTALAPSIAVYQAHKHAANFGVGRFVEFLPAIEADPPNTPKCNLYRDEGSLRATLQRAALTALNQASW